MKPDLKETLAKVAKAEKDIIGMIDRYIEANSIIAIIWAIGYTANYSLVKSSHGNDIKTFDFDYERTICDLLRSRTQVDVQFRNDAMKRYVMNKSRNIDLLYRYAKNFRIQKIVRQYI